MTQRAPAPILLVCAALCVACLGDKGFTPGSFEPDPPILNTVEVTPAAADLFTVPPNKTLQLAVQALDENGARMPGMGTVTWSSGNPAVAEVNSSGLVTAIAPGTAEIWVTVTLAGTERSAFMTVKVYGESGAYPEIAGVYDLSALITGFDPAWGDLTGYRYSAVLTLQGPDRGRYEGTYAHLQLLDHTGQTEYGESSGFVRGSIGHDGRVVIELANEDHTWTTWYGEGNLGSRSIGGRWGCCGHIAGTFTATKR